jgi:hypothetical protein
MTTEQVNKLTGEEYVEKYVEGEWEPVKLFLIKEGDTFRAHTPEDTSDDRTWFIATKSYQDLQTKEWVIEADVIDRSETEEDGGDLPTEEA